MGTIAGLPTPPPRWERFAGNVAESYPRDLVPTIFEPWAQELVALAAPRPGQRVLDVACGTGVVARLLARDVGPGRVTGLDVNPGMLAVARSLPPGPAITWQEGDALRMPLPAAAFELVLCQQGVQFFTDRAAGLREMRRVLAPGGRMVLAIWGPIERSPGFLALAEALARHLGPAAAAAARSPFSLSDITELRQLLHAAGLPNVEIHYRERNLQFPSPGEFIRRYGRSSPLAAFLGDADATTLEAVVPDVTGALASYHTEHGLSFPIGNHLAVVES